MQVISNFIIRPYRDVYKLEDLGPPVFYLDDKEIYRKDFSLNSLRGELKCSWYNQTDSVPRPCVVYCHGNCGSRRDALEIRNVVLSCGYSLLSFDFGGCGLSQGQYVTLGCLEQEDIAEVIEYLQKTGRATTIVLWGRSMGAAAVMLYISRHRDFPVVVLDSPFASLSDLAHEMVSKYRFIPSGLHQLIFKKVCDHVRKVASFNLQELNPVDRVAGLGLPAVILHSTQDSLVSTTHSKRIFEAFAGPKFLLETPGSHNSQRHCTLTMRVMNIVEYFVRQVPEFEDGNATLRGPLPDLTETTKQILKKSS